MHIPDSAISPATSATALAAMLPAWLAAGRALRDRLSSRQVPMLALGAAFSFTIMLFNIPAPGGTTVHPVGAVLLAVLLGPWAAVIGVTVALVIQALFFGDGGLLALGANCFTMAFAMPLVGFIVYRLAAGRSGPASTRRVVAAGLGAYVGLNAAALLTALLLGIQPALAHDAAGHALYFPFGLRVTVPALMAGHLGFAGPAEAIVTALAIRYLVAAGIPLYGLAGNGASRPRRDLLWAGLAAMIALAPLGLLASGDAWGEWSTAEIARKVGYTPARMAAQEHGWHGFNLFPDYLSGHGPIPYAAAGATGAGIIVTVILLVSGRLVRRRTTDAAAHTAASSHMTSIGPGELPDWMSETTQPIRDSPPVFRLPSSVLRLPSSVFRRDFVSRTLAGLADGARETVFTERWAREDGLLQRLDARAKIAGLLGLIALTACLHNAIVLIALYALALALTIASRIPLLTILRRVWLTVPLFVGAMSIPAILNVVTPGRPVIVLYSHPLVAVTAPGLVVAAILTFRVAIAVTFAALLTMTTRWNDLLHGLRVLFVPRMFVIVLSMTCRYLAVLLQSASDMFTARRSRTVGRACSAEGRRYAGSAIGGLFGRTLALTDEVHAAMQSRGWTGEARSFSPITFAAADVVWLCFVFGAAAVAVIGERIG